MKSYNIIFNHLLKVGHIILSTVKSYNIIFLLMIQKTEPKHKSNTKTIELNPAEPNKRVSEDNIRISLKSIIYSRTYLIFFLKSILSPSILLPLSNRSITQATVFSQSQDCFLGFLFLQIRSVLIRFDSIVYLKPKFLSSFTSLSFLKSTPDSYFFLLSLKSKTQYDYSSFYVLFFFGRLSY